MSAPAREALTALYEQHGRTSQTVSTTPTETTTRQPRGKASTTTAGRSIGFCGNAQGRPARHLSRIGGEGHIVFDVDHGGQAAVDALVRMMGTPLLVVPSATPGRYHVWFVCEDAREIGNGDWSLDGSAPKCGELRSTGNLVLWHPDKIANALANGAKPGDKIPARLSPAQVRQLLVATPGKGNGAAPMNGRRAMVTDYDLAQNYRAQEWVEGGRNKLLNSLVFACGLANDEALAEEITQWAVDAGHQPERRARATLKSGWTKGQEARDEALSSASDLSPLGIHLRWMAARSNQWRYIVAGTSASGVWARWDGARFERLSTGYVFRDCKALVSHVADEVLQKANNVKVARRATKPMRQPSFVSDVVKFNASECIDRIEDYDAHPLLLNTPGGVVDLKSGDMAPHDRARKFLKVSGATPSSAPCPTWARCLADWSGGDAELVSYLQRLVGYSLRGDNQEHAVVFMHGPGSNGKSVFLRVLQSMHGDYNQSASHSVFTATKQEEHPTALASLMGARLASIPEVPAGARFNEEALKRASGGDELTARFMRQDFFTFIPQFLPLIVGNNEPSTRDVGESMRRRLIVLPFDFTVPKDQRDKGLFDKLRGELDAIMGWAVAGHLQYLERGLDPPAKVLAATEEYFADNDRIGQFLERSTRTVPGGRVGASMLYGEYVEWLRGAGEHPESQRRFTQELRRRGIGSAKTSKARFYSGIEYKDADG